MFPVYVFEYVQYNITIIYLKMLVKQEVIKYWNSSV